MATNSRELGSPARSSVAGDTYLEAQVVKVKTFATDAGSHVIKRGEPVVYDTIANFWKPLDGNGINGTDTIKGFAYEDITQDPTDEVQGNVMLAGKLDYAILDEIGGSDFGTGSDIDATEAELKAALRTDCRDIGIHIEGLSQVR